jgi:tetratricopeptide (TPR) repeat protein
LHLVDGVNQRGAREAAMRTNEVVTGIVAAACAVVLTAGAAAQMRPQTVNAAPTATPAPTAAPVARAAEAAGAPAGPTAEIDRLLLAYRTADARAAVDAVKAQAASDPQIAIALGRVLDQEKKYTDAVAQLQKAAAMPGAGAAAQVYLGETYLRQKNSSAAGAAFTKAAEVATKAVAANAKDAQALYCLGVAQQRLKQYDKATATLLKARALDASNPMVSYQLGVTAAFQQRWQDAVTELTKAIDADSGIAYAYYYRALSQDKLGKKDQLVLDMERFLALAPAAPEAEQAAAIVKAAKR